MQLIAMPRAFQRVLHLCSEDERTNLAKRMKTKVPFTHFKNLFPDLDARGCSCLFVWERQRTSQNSWEKILRERELSSFPFYSPCLFLQHSLTCSFWWQTPGECPPTVLIPFCKLKGNKSFCPGWWINCCGSLVSISGITSEVDVI